MMSSNAPASTSSPQLSLEKQLNDMHYRMLRVEYPGWHVHPLHEVAFATRAVFDELCSATPLSFASNLAPTLQSTLPPPIQFFQTLPTPQSSLGRLWGIYVVTLRKGRRHKLYVGSGTEELYSVHTRLAEYSNSRITKQMRKRGLLTRRLPLLVRRALHRGYKFQSSGLLCWMPIPAPELVPQARVRIIGLEALFAQLFFATVQKKFDPILDFPKWKRNDTTYTPLCSHAPIWEDIRGNFDFTGPQLIALAEARKLKRRLQARMKKRVQAVKNPDGVKATHKAVVARILAEKRHYCAVCKQALATPSALKAHLASQAHTDAVAVSTTGIIPVKSESALKAEAFRNKVLATKKWYCALCEYNAPVEVKLKKHFTTNKHKNHAAAAAATAAAASTSTSA